MRGVEGGVTALSATIADEWLINSNIITKHI